MAIGFFNEPTGDRKDGNYYCYKCGEQVPVGVKHHHASEVPELKRRIAGLEAVVEQYRKADSMRVLGVVGQEERRPIRAVSDRDTLR